MIIVGIVTVVGVVTDDCVAIVCGDAAAAGAVDRGGVGFVEDQAGAVAGAKIGEFGDVGDVAVHAENGFGDDEFAAA